jgi:hypothetical protein
MPSSGAALTRNNLKARLSVVIARWLAAAQRRGGKDGIKRICAANRKTFFQPSVPRHGELWQLPYLKRMVSSYGPQIGFCFLSKLEAHALYVPLFLNLEPLKCRRMLGCTVL